MKKNTNLLNDTFKVCNLDTVGSPGSSKGTVDGSNITISFRQVSSGSFSKQAVIQDNSLIVQILDITLNEESSKEDSIEFSLLGLNGA